MPTLLGKRERWLWMTADEMKRYPPGEHDELIFGRNWDGQWQTGPNAWQVRSIDEITYTPGEHATLTGGTGWDGQWQTGPNYARILGEDDANGYSVGSGSAPYSDGIGLGTPVISGVDVVNISGSDNGFRIVSGAIAWALDPSESWNTIQIGCLVHIPVTAATGLGADSLQIGVCHGAGGIPGIVAAGSVGNAIFWRSVGWSYHTSGTMQAAASNAAQLGKLVAGSLSTANISTISRVGCINSSAAVVRCPVVITITKGSPNWTLAVTRRTTTTAGPGFDRTEGITKAATENSDPAAMLGAQHNQHSASIAFSAGGGDPDTFFVSSGAVGAYVSGIYIARLA